MGFLPALLSAGLGYLGQQQANGQTANAQSAAQNSAQQYAAMQGGQAKQYSQQALQQALQNLGQYQQQNPAPVNQLGAIQAPGAGQGQPQQSFGGGQVNLQHGAPQGGVMGGGAPQGGFRPGMPPTGGLPPNPTTGPTQPKPPAPNPTTGPTQPVPPQGQTQRLQQLYPMVQQMLQGQQTPQPMARSTGGIM